MQDFLLDDEGHDGGAGRVGFEEVGGFEEVAEGDDGDAGGGNVSLGMDALGWGMKRSSILDKRDKRTVV